MSGPIEEPDRPTSDFGISTIEVKEGRHTRIGDMGIMRVLPTKQRRTIGPWCFVDLMAPEDIDRPPPLEIGPHPHIGLSTVTWLFAGSARHSDSLGTVQAIKPGELNLMTSGRGIAHAEESLETRSAEATGGIMGVQMWLAQPDGTRDGDSRFQHHKDLPMAELDAGEARILLGSYGGETSPAESDHQAVGLDISLRDRSALMLDAAHEHGVVPIDRPIRVDDAIVEPGALALVPPGYGSIELAARSGPARVMVVGGAPLGEEVKMWWNFVARTTEEITDAWRDWQSNDEDRFGPVPSDLPRIDAPPPPWVRQDT